MSPIFGNFNRVIIGYAYKNNKKILGLKVVGIIWDQKYRGTMNIEPPTIHYFFCSGKGNNNNNAPQCYYGTEYVSQTQYETVYSQQCSTQYEEKCETQYETQCTTQYETVREAEFPSQEY
jgi:hypothetical protein